MNRYELFQKIQNGIIKLACDEEDKKLLDVWNLVSGETWCISEQKFYKNPDTIYNKGCPEKECSCKKDAKDCSIDIHNCYDD